MQFLALRYVLLALGRDRVGSIGIPHGASLTCTLTEVTLVCCILGWTQSLPKRLQALPDSF